MMDERGLAYIVEEDKRRKDGCPNYRKKNMHFVHFAFTMNILVMRSGKNKHAAYQNKAKEVWNILPRVIVSYKIIRRCPGRLGLDKLHQQKSDWS